MAKARKKRKRWAAAEASRVMWRSESGQETQQPEVQFWEQRIRWAVRMLDMPLPDDATPEEKVRDKIREIEDKQFLREVALAYIAQRLVHAQQQQASGRAAAAKRAKAQPRNPSGKRKAEVGERQERRLRRGK